MPSVVVSWVTTAPNRRNSPNANELEALKNPDLTGLHGTLANHGKTEDLELSINGTRVRLLPRE